MVREEERIISVHPLHARRQIVVHRPEAPRNVHPIPLERSDQGSDHPLVHGREQLLSALKSDSDLVVVLLL